MLKLKTLALVVIVFSFGNFHYIKADGADWKFLKANDEGEFSCDAENITRSATNIVGIWLKVVYSEEYKKRKALVL